MAYKLICAAYYHPPRYIDTLTSAHTDFQMLFYDLADNDSATFTVEVIIAPSGVMRYWPR